MLEMFFLPLTAGEQFNFLCTGAVYHFSLGLYFELNVKVELFSAHRLLDHFNHVKILFLGSATSHLMFTFFPTAGEKVQVCGIDKTCIMWDGNCFILYQCRTAFYWKLHVLDSWLVEIIVEYNDKVDPSSSWTIVHMSKEKYTFWTKMQNQSYEHQEGQTCQPGNIHATVLLFMKLFKSSKKNTYLSFL